MLLMIYNFSCEVQPRSQCPLKRGCVIDFILGRENVTNSSVHYRTGKITNSVLTYSLQSCWNYFADSKKGMIKYILTELGQAGGENIWLSVMAHGPP